MVVVGCAVVYLMSRGVRGRREASVDERFGNGWKKGLSRSVEIVLSRAVVTSA
jgi:hypothetical protein